MRYKLDVNPIPLPNGISDEALPMGVYLLGEPRIETWTDAKTGTTGPGIAQDVLRIDDGDELPSDVGAGSRFRRDGKRLWYGSAFSLNDKSPVRLCVTVIPE